jgi:hypothetical protein
MCSFYYLFIEIFISQLKYRYNDQFLMNEFFLFLLTLDFLNPLKNSGSIYMSSALTY